MPYLRRHTRLPISIGISFLRYSQVRGAVHHVPKVKVVAVESQDEGVIPEDVKDRPEQFLLQFRKYSIFESGGIGQFPSRTPGRFRTRTFFWSSEV